MPDIDPDVPILEIPISPGTTWTDNVGNIWTSFGSLVMQDDSVQSVRQRLVSFLRSHHPKWQFYENPPDILVTPAVVINPSDPYILPYTSGGPTAVVWGLDLVLVTKRATPKEGLLRIEFMFTEIQESLRLYPSTRWLQLGEVGTVEMNGVEHLSAVMSLAVVSDMKPEPT